MILITGGLGYIGSHIALDMLAKGHEVVIVDNLSHAAVDRLQQLEYLTKLYVPFVRLDVRNTPVLQKVFEQYPIDYVIHAASFKSIAESRHKPLEYYNNNIGCMMSILRALQRTGVKRFVNLSSMAVYGESGDDWLEEDAFNLYVDNPYIRAQQMIEHMIQDVYRVDNQWQILNVRLSNVIGAYPEGYLGEWTPLLPKAILPNLLQLAAGQKEHLDIVNGLATSDGTAERDFIHIKDVVDAVYKLMLWSNTQQNFLEHFNLGSGQVLSINELVNCIERVTQQSIRPHLNFVSETDSQSYARLGADITKLHTTVDWKSKFQIHDAIMHQWIYYQRSLSIH